MKSRFSNDQIVAILNQTKAGVSVKKVCCEHDISHATFYTWRKKLGNAKAGSTAIPPKEEKTQQTTKSCAVDRPKVASQQEVHKPEPVVQG